MPSLAASDSSSRLDPAIEVRFFVRVLASGAEDAEHELNGKTGWISEGAMMVRVRPESPEAGRAMRPGVEVVAEVCYATDQRVVRVEGRVAERADRSGYLKLRLDLVFGHPRLRERWEHFVAKVRAHFASRPGDVP